MHTSNLELTTMMLIQSKLHSFLASARKALSKHVPDRSDPGQIPANISSITEDELQPGSHGKSPLVMHATGYMGQNGMQLAANAEYSRTLETPEVCEYFAHQSAR
jgi:hypothetical protein